MHTAFYLGVLHRRFLSGAFDENLMEYIDKTHYVVNMNNGRTLGFGGDTSVSYAKVVSGGDSMTMVIKIFWRATINDRIPNVNFYKSKHELSYSWFR